ncbi:MAG: cellulase family glycosylhydrolase [Bacteroidales bacterium]|nr:cellulase family glycosylhydrolase [Bacteroidales bacterium]
MKKILAFVMSALALIACNDKPDNGSEDNITPEVPTAITLSVTEINAVADGGSFEMTVSAPSRPKVTGLPSWVKLTDGVFKNYSIKYILTVEANPTYESRSASATVSCKDVPEVSFSINQEAKEEIKEPTPPDPDDANAAWKLCSTLGIGINLGNHFDAFYNGTWAGDKFLYPAEDCWDGAIATNQTFTGIANAGFMTVRIPVTWLNMIGPAPDYAIDETWLNRVYECVMWAHEAGLNVVVNMHHDENHHSIIENGVDIDTRWQDIKNAVNNPELNAAIIAQIKGAWKNIATKFADCGEWLILEGFNEINDGGWGFSADFLADPTRQCNILNQWNQAFVDAVRGAGGYNETRWLSVPTYAANPEYEKYAVMPTDPAGKTILAVHFYDPSDYTIGGAQYSDWGHTGDPSRKAKGGDEDHVKSVFSNLCTKYVEKNIPVYLGEFGCSMRDKNDTRAWAFYLYYLEYVVKAAKTYGLPCMLWDNGANGAGQEHHGYINHANGSYIGNSRFAVDKMMKAWKTDSDSYTLTSVYNSAPMF